MLEWGKGKLNFKHINHGPINRKFRLSHPKETPWTFSIALAHANLPPWFQIQFIQLHHHNTQPYANAICHFTTLEFNFVIFRVQCDIWWHLINILEWSGRLHSTDVSSCAIAIIAMSEIPSITSAMPDTLNPYANEWLFMQFMNFYFKIINGSFPLISHCG